MTRRIYPRLGHFAAKLSDRRDWLNVREFFKAAPNTPRIAGHKARRRLGAIRWRRVDLDRRPVAKRLADRTSFLGAAMSDGARNCWHRTTVARMRRRLDVRRARYPHAVRGFMRYRERRVWGGGW